MCTLDYDYYAVIWDQTPHISQKERECDACWALIPCRTPYLSHKSLFDGRWTNEAMCFECWWVSEAFAMEHGASCLPSMLEETLRECMNRLSAPERRKAPSPDRWASELASVLVRRRTSERQRRHLRQMWFRRALRREQHMTWRIINARKQLPPTMPEN